MATTIMDQDIHRASLLFKKAAESGHAPSQYYLGVIFLYGQGGFPRDYDMAFYWMDRAARGKASRDTADAAARALGELRVVLSNSTTRMDALSRRFRVGPRGGPEDSETLVTALDADADGRVSREEFGAKWHRPPAQVLLYKVQLLDPKQFPPELQPLGAALDAVPFNNSVTLKSKYQLFDF